MDTDIQETLLTSFSDRELGEMMQEFFLDDAVDIVEETPANVVKRVLKNIAPESRELINQIMHYPKYIAGSIMTVEYVSLRESLTVSETFDRIRKTGIDKETIYTFM